MATINRSEAASPANQSVHPPRGFTDSPVQMDAKTPNELEAENSRLLEAIQECAQSTFGRLFTFLTPKQSN